MRVADVMSTRVVAVQPGASLKEVVRRLAEYSVTALPVVDDAGVLVGVVSEADVIAGVVVPDPRAHVLPIKVPRKSWPAQVADVMTRAVITVGPHSDLADAAHLMTAAGLKSMPVVESGRVVGMLSRRDVILALSRRDDLIEQECMDMLRSLGGSWSVEVREGIAIFDGSASTWQLRCAERLLATIPGVVGVVSRAEHDSRGTKEQSESPLDLEASGPPLGGL